MPGILRSRVGMGGECQHCGRAIRRGEPVRKVDDGGKSSWSVKDLSPGSWVCDSCALAYIGQLTFDFGEGVG